MGRSAEARAQALSKLPHSPALSKLPSKSPSFEELGLRPPIVAALRASFPNVKLPTTSQAEFIPAVLEGKDVLLKDVTGSGKSFGLIMALLSKPRKRLLDLRTGKPPDKHSITSLVIVPHRDLAYQMLNWIHQIYEATGLPRSPLSSLGQVLIRDGITNLTTRLTTLREDPPHILIGTPQALLEVWNADKAALQLRTLSAVVVDEVDYLIETSPKIDGGKMYKKARKKIDRHPSATKQLLDIIYAERIKAYQRFQDDSGRDDLRDRKTDDYSSAKPAHTPQLIMSSATLRNHLRIFLRNESGWLRRDDDLQRVRGGSPRLSTLPEAAEETDGLGGNSLLHSILVVSERGDIKNIRGAVAMVQSPSIETPDHEAILPEVPLAMANSELEPELDYRLVEKYKSTPSPFNPNMLEAIATSFALDVPSIALLVLHSSAPVHRAIFELREMGVNARGLDLLTANKGQAHLLHGGEGNPTLLVSTLATTRGLDLPELTHVFILGVPEGPRVHSAVDGYLHMAGRVGRFGRGGRVITVVEGDENVGEQETKVRDGAWRMRRIFRKAKIIATEFEHFE